MEMDPEHASVGVADAALAFLRKGAWPESAIIGPRWFQGESMGTPQERLPPTASDGKWSAVYSATRR